MVEPKKVFEALEDYDWVEAMHEELNNFKRNKVWELVEKPKYYLNVIGTKWIFKNKLKTLQLLIKFLCKNQVLPHKMQAKIKAKINLPLLKLKSLLKVIKG